MVEGDAEPRLSPGRWIQKYVFPGASSHFALRNLRIAKIGDVGLCFSSVAGMAISIACGDDDPSREAVDLAESVAVSSCSTHVMLLDVVEVDDATGEERAWDAEAVASSLGVERVQGRPLRVVYVPALAPELLPEGGSLEPHDADLCGEQTHDDCAGFLWKTTRGEGHSDLIVDTIACDVAAKSLRVTFVMQEWGGPIFCSLDEIHVRAGVA